MKRLAALLLLAAAPVWAQELPANEDPRLRTVDYVLGDIVHLPTSPQTIQTLLLAPGDQIKSVIVSDPGAFVITVAGTGDSIALKPNGPSSLAMMSVRTEQRSYEFELVPGEASMAPSVVRFSYDTTVRQAPQPALASVPRTPGVNYRLSGTKALRPIEVGDDGKKTYITWRDDQAMPAIFSVNPAGMEEMVEGSVRGGIFTIDRVHPELIFRIDRESASARRVVKRGRHD